MFDFENKKLKRIFTVSLLVLVILMVIIKFLDLSGRVGGFFNMLSSILSVMNSIYIGIIIAYLLNPLERFFSRTVLKKMKAGKMHKFLSILFTYLTFIGLISVFFIIALPQLLKSISELPSKLNVFIGDLTTTVNGWIQDVETSEFYKSMVNTLGAENFDLRHMFNSFISTFLNLESFLPQIANSLIGIVSGIYSAAANLLIGLILSIYLLAAKSRLGAQGKMLTTAMLGESRSKRFIRFLKFSDRTFGSFIQGKIINSIITGIITAIVFSIFGLPYPQLLAVIIAVTDIIPVFGPFLGGIPCGFLVLIAAPEKLILFVILIVVIQQVDGNYIAPKILGESTGLSSLGVFVAILIMGGYFGLIGMIIGVPLFAVIYTIIKRAVDKKLAARGLSTDIVDYYYKRSDDLSEEEHHSYFKKIVDFFINAAKKLFALIVKIFSGKPKAPKSGQPKTPKAKNGTAPGTEKDKK